MLPLELLNGNTTIITGTRVSLKIMDIGVYGLISSAKSNSFLKMVVG
jgi:hypothetical protein